MKIKITMFMILAMSVTSLCWALSGSMGATSGTVAGSAPTNGATAASGSSPTNGATAGGGSSPTNGTSAGGGSSPTNGTTAGGGSVPTSAVKAGGDLSPASNGIDSTNNTTINGLTGPEEANQYHGVGPGTYHKIDSDTGVETNSIY